mgnify:CR=1 FL=1
MKRLIQWLARVFNANITVEKRVEVPVIKEVVKEVPKEVIRVKTVEVEKPIYVVSSTIPSGTKLIEGDVVIDGDLEVKGNLIASGGGSCLNGIKVRREAKAKKGGGK